ncbi:MAG: 4-hydroxy-tetrahydrodipicolinate synthase [Aquabacterium sp.]
MSDFSGIWAAIVTPFQDQHTPHAGQPLVDHAALRTLVQHLRAEGISGLVALGSTGEAAALNDAEQDAVLGTVREAAEGLPVMAGLAGNHVGHLHARLAHFNTLPLAGVLSPAPYYVRPSQPALVAHFQALADACEAPLVLYDIPYRTGVTMSLDTLLTLAAHPNIHAVKDCGGSLDKTEALIMDGRLQVMSGEDALIFTHLCLGAHGAISAASQVAPAAFMALHDAVKAGRLAHARRWQQQLRPLLQALFTEPNPALVKQALHMQGWMAPTVRPPMLPASDPAQAVLADVMAQVLQTGAVEEDGRREHINARPAPPPAAAATSAHNGHWPR